MFLFFFFPWKRMCVCFRGIPMNVVLVDSHENCHGDYIQDFITLYTWIVWMGIRSQCIWYLRSDVHALKTLIQSTFRGTSIRTPATSGTYTTGNWCMFYAIDLCFTQLICVLRNWSVFYATDLCSTQLICVLRNWSMFYASRGEACLPLTGLSWRDRVVVLIYIYIHISVELIFCTHTNVYIHAYASHSWHVRVVVLILHCVSPWHTLCVCVYIYIYIYTYIHVHTYWEW